MRFGWLSDIHLDFLDDAAIQEFLRGLSSRGADAWLLGGDIGQADSVIAYLQLLEDVVPGKMYFTLGNHDFYGSSLTAVQDAVRRLVNQSGRLVWLTETEPQLISDGLALVGDDGWADARCGDALSTPVMLNDFYAIAELKGLSRRELIRTLNRLGDEAATRLAPKLERAARACGRVVVLTHVPPFREASWHEGQPSNDDYVPWFSCRAVGDVILACARLHAEVHFLVLCGHTHGSGTYSPLDNVSVYTAQAEYAAPRVQALFEIKSGTSAGAWPTF